MTVSPPLAPSQDKDALRGWMKARLETLPADERERRSQAILERAHAVPAFREARNVFTCLSFGAEVDTWPLVASLVEQGRRTVYVPRCSTDHDLMTVHRYPCSLGTLSFGLRQPAASVPPLPASDIDDTLDCALVLGLAFDPANGYRLGHGAGYFDRFLAQHHVPTIALAFEAQLVRELPHEDHDVPMEWIVTENAVFAFEGRPASPPGQGPFTH